MTENRDQSDSQSPHQKLDELAEKLDKARKADQPEVEAQPSLIGLGLKYAAEFSAATLVGAFLGWALDNFLATSPWGLMVGLFLGVAAGLREIVRSAKKDVDTSL